MKSCRLFVVLSCCLLFSFPINRIAAHPQSVAGNERLNFLSQAMRRLGIPVILVDGNVKLQRNVAIDIDAPVTKQELLNLFIDELRTSNAVLVKSGSIMQIVPNSRALGEGFEPVTSPPEMGSRPQRGVSLNYENASIYDFIPQVASLLGFSSLVISPAIRGSVTLLGEAPIGREQVYSILNAVLKNNGALIIESAGNYQIVPASRDVPQGWKISDSPPAPSRSFPRPGQRGVKQEELEFHILTRVEPSPVFADGRRLTGEVQLAITLNERGELELLSLGNAIAPAALPLAEAAIEAVRQWHFMPFVDSNGLPQRVSSLITIAAP
jgi:type II secretory pathway component GspD/PulD (secretin)